jgi:hypothetical protein
VWTLNNPNTIREKLDERDTEQVSWRIEPFGWDKDERIYYVLDDNRLYRREDAPPPPEEAPKSKAKAKPKKGRSTRSNKRRRVSRTIPETSPEEEDEPVKDESNGIKEEPEEPRMDSFAYKEWELIAVSMDDYTEFIDTIRKSRDPNEKSLVKDIEKHVFPILLEQEEERKRKEVRRLRELENLQKLATAKRSSRLAGKMEKVKEQQEKEEAERKHLADLEMAHKEQERLEQMEHARESRRETREQRLKEREMKRILEEERQKQDAELLLKLESADQDADAERARASQRKLKADIEKRKRELENLQQDDSWYFDCSKCGVHGPNLDDGSHSMACDKCNVWQHSKCHGIKKETAEREDFHFVCEDCKRKSENPVPPLKLRFGTSPKTAQSDSFNGHLQQSPPKAPVFLPQQGLPSVSRPTGPFPSTLPPSRPAGGLVYPGPPRPPPNGVQRPDSSGYGRPQEVARSK